jgi:hypothetical protein
MIMGGYVINTQEEVATVTMVKWLVLEGVVVVVAIILERRVRCPQVRRDLNP